jgi:small subunit ribosomal protein S1
MEENQIDNPNAESQETTPAAEQAAPEQSAATSNAPDATDGGDGEPAVQAEATQPVSNVKIEEPVQETVAAHDDFDWSVDKRNVAAYTREEKEKYDKVYENTFVQLNDGEMIRGLVVGITKTDVVLNIGFQV